MRHENRQDHADDRSGQPPLTRVLLWYPPKHGGKPKEHSEGDNRCNDRRRRASHAHAVEHDVEREPDDADSGTELDGGGPAARDERQRCQGQQDGEPAHVPCPVGVVLRDRI